MILIAGGYGVVGQRIAADLASDYPVVVAGRHLERARIAAATIGTGATARELDVMVESSVSAALAGASIVVNCVDQPRRGLLHAAMKRGLSYTDITPHLTALGRGRAYETLHAAARAGGARVVLGTGLVPGISSVMVRALAMSLGGADAIDTALLLSAHDETGPASREYLRKELTMAFSVHVGGHDRPARPFDDRRAVDFPAPFGRRSAYTFPFSDQVLYPRTMGAATAVSRLALEPAWLGPVLDAVVRTRLTRLLASGRVQRALLTDRRPAAFEASGPTFALRVTVSHQGRALSGSLVGNAQADAAAAGASATVRALIAGHVSAPGAWMPEQVVEPTPFWAHLRKSGLHVDLPAPESRRV